MRVLLAAIRNALRAVACLFFLPLIAGNGFAEEAENSLSKAMETRYAPYADWESRIDLSDLEALEKPFWRGAEVIRSASTEVLPLAGLKIALDPGHVGGEWAFYEGREFRISETDYFVREGELVLEVAQIAATKLRELGAEVTLLRETNEPVNPKSPTDYLEKVITSMDYPVDTSLISMADYGVKIRDQAVKEAIVIGDLLERARLINEEIQPDAVLSLHINAAPWPASPDSGSDELTLVDSNHLHVLIFGCMSEGEMQSGRQLEQFKAKLRNGSGPEELGLAKALAASLAGKTALPASSYSGQNAAMPDPGEPYVWARNLLLLRMVECPVVLLEPYVANGKEAYHRIQTALDRRKKGKVIDKSDILIEYADGIVEGVLNHYGFRPSLPI
ncbi:MAG: N-acetylmuramoyl-L-alanine amidase [Verrucomicrobiota bacterium]